MTQKLNLNAIGEAANMAGSPRNRWAILAMLFGANAINYLDRSALSVAMPFITRDYHLTKLDQGVIFSSFFVGYAIFNVVGGYLADRFGTRRVMATAMGCWSAFCAMTALTVNFASLFAARLLFGIGEGPVQTTMNKTLAETFPEHERARAVGIQQAGGPFGGALAGPVVGFLALTLGWRTAFVIIGAIGAVWVLAWLRLFRSAPAVQRVRRTVSEVSIWQQMATVIRSPAVLALAVSLACYNYVVFFFLTWFPSYLIEAHGLSLASMSIVAGLPWIGGGLGYVSGGLFSDWLSKKMSPVRARKFLLVGCLSLAACFVVASGFAASTFEVVALMVAGVFMMMVAGPGYWALIQDLTPPDKIGTAGGVMHGVGNLSGIIAPTLTAFVVEATGMWGAGFGIAGLLGFVGGIIVLLGVSTSTAKG